MWDWPAPDYQVCCTASGCGGNGPTAPGNRAQCKSHKHWRDMFITTSLQPRALLVASSLSHRMNSGSISGLPSTCSMIQKLS